MAVSSRVAVRPAVPPPAPWKSYLAAGLAASALGLGAYVYSQCDSPLEDLGTLVRVARLQRQIQEVADQKEWTYVNVWDETVRQHGSRVAARFIDSNTTHTFVELDRLANQIGRWALAQGFVSGDTVAIMMDNRVEFIASWLGLAKVGVKSSLINTHISGKPLVHALTVCNAVGFIIGAEHGAAAGAAMDDMKRAGKWFSSGGFVSGMRDLATGVAAQDSSPIDRSARAGISPNDVLMYIYTSGTTGYPKASVISHRKFYGVALGFVTMFKVTTPDVIYAPLPLYHTAAGIAGIGMSWCTGAAFVSRRKFSVSHFWEDIRSERCTVVQYIGEVCRYLLAVPPSPDDGKGHCVRIMVGNGLKPEVWAPFIERFKIPNIGEFYGATEGNGALLNVKNKIGAVGYVAPLIECISPIKIVKFNVETEQLERDANGHCIVCAPGEPGELISKIDSARAASAFEGYTDKQATEKKIITDVFEKGDRWVRSGDLLRREKDGFFYFVDRIGDTFRWKGENVSTAEVATVLAGIQGVQEVNVYGVTVPGQDGRAGMAALVVDGSFSLEDFYARVKADLPSYAQPLFIRILAQMEITTTFKHKKVELQREGIDPVRVQDPIYYRDDHAKAFVRLDAELHQRLVTLRSRL